MTLSLDTAYRSFGGEVEASSTPTICRLPDSRRHQLWAIALVVLQQGEAALARIAQAAQPNGTPQLGEVHLVRRLLLSANQNDTPAALSPLRRQNPREEPGALAAHAGICTGGGWQRPSLP